MFRVLTGHPLRLRGLTLFRHEAEKALISPVFRYLAVTSHINCQL